MTPRTPLALALAALAILALVAAGPAGRRPPIPPTAAPADSLIRTGETHFAHLWQLTFGGQNAEAYWSGDGRRLTFQSTRGDLGCDQQFVIDLETGSLTRVSPGAGRTTCGYFYDRDRRVLFASTHLGGAGCPPEPDMSQGYVWPVYASYDIFTARPDGSDLRRLTDHPDYDAEATLSVDGKWIVFTSLREGDIDLYKMRPDGGGLTRLTREVGYDGGAFFSRDGQWICWRTHHPADSAETARYRDLLSRNLVRPGAMDLWVMRADGTGKRQVTRDPGASFAPYFTPDGKRLIYASNKDQPRGRDFNLYLVDVAGGTPEPVTTDPDFDGFPMFSPDGRWLVFCSNRGGKVAGETNVFIAEWRP
jgi:Tol biopolymer transport system component